LVQSVHLGAYPATASDDTKTPEKEVAKHKAKIKEFETLDLNTLKGSYIGSRV
jgi:uncharacterized protein YjlB